MRARALASLLVLVLVGPSVVAATCELTCAMASHHHNSPSSTAASCHEHQGANQGVGVHADPSALCHESGDLPTAVVDAWLNSVIVAAASPAMVVVAPAIPTRSMTRAHERRTLFDPRSPHRPLRV